MQGANEDLIDEIWGRDIVSASQNIEIDERTIGKVRKIDPIAS